MTAILVEFFGSIMPLFGLTQYLFGAVVFILKHTFRSLGLDKVRYSVAISVYGPVGVCVFELEVRLEGKKVRLELNLKFK